MTKYNIPLYDHIMLSRNEIGKEFHTIFYMITDGMGIVKLRDNELRIFNIFIQDEIIDISPINGIDLDFDKFKFALSSFLINLGDGCISKRINIYYNNGIYHSVKIKRNNINTSIEFDLIRFEFPIVK